MEDVSINISHLNGLLGLNQGIFQQVLIFQIFFDIAGGTGQFFDHALVGFEGGLEIDDGLFQLHELNQFFISSWLVQLALNLLALAVNGTQGRQIELSIAVENLKDKTWPHEGVKIAQLSIDENIEQGQFFQAGRDDGIFCNDNTKRDSDIVSLVISLLSDGYVYDDQCVLILDGDPRHFLGIEWCS